MNLQISFRNHPRYLIWVLLSNALFSSPVLYLRAEDSPQVDISYEPVGPGDLVRIDVAGWPEASKTYRISAEGLLTLPLLKQPVRVSGLFAADMERILADAFVKDQILVSPVVSVGVQQYRSRPVTIVGAVKKPATLQATGRLRLLDAIAGAEGLTADAGAEILITRRQAASTVAGETSRISVKELLSGLHPELNAELRGGEEIRVPEAPRFYVAGNVRNPGAYLIKDNDGMSVLKALAVSQGMMQFSRAEAYIYRLNDGESQRSEIQIPLRNILKRKSNDVSLRAGDILYIPDNSGKRLAATVIERITSFGGTTASGLIIWR